MTYINNIVVLVFFFIFNPDTYINGEIASSPVKIQQLSSYDKVSNKVQFQVNKVDDHVNITLRYECLCPDCRKFDTSQFKEVVQKLSQYLNIKTYPYGNAKTFEDNGKYIFECQHGPGECYGNKLHACALDIINNQTDALLYNSCMMGQDGQGSDDHSAQECGASLKIDSQPIIDCAKSERGTQLLKYYGDESRKIIYYYVPYILINGKVNDGENFMRDVCAAFATPPPPCAPAI